MGMFNQYDNETIVLLEALTFNLHFTHENWNLVYMHNFHQAMTKHWIQKQ